MRSHVVGVGQVEKRLDVQLPLAGVAEQRGGHLVPLQHVLHPHQEIGQHLRRHGHVFDDRHRPARPLHPVQRRLHLVDQLPEQLGLVGLERLPGAERQPLLLPDLVDQALQPARAPPAGRRPPARPAAPPRSRRESAGRTAASASRARLKCRRSIRSQAVGCAGRMSSTARGGLLQAVEQQQRHAAMPRQRLRWPAWPR